MKKVMGILICNVLLFCSVGFAAVINVPGDYATIQAGIDAALEGDTVLVADGTYSGSGNCALEPHGKNLVLISAGGAANCIIDCLNSVRCINYVQAENTSSRFEGFTVRNGYADEPSDGGAIYCENSSPVITNCVFESNQGRYGSAIQCFIGSAPEISNCLFIANTGYRGGGVSYDECLPVSITNCAFTDNTASQSGGGIFSNFADVMINDCSFSGNQAYDQGGAINFRHSSATVTGCDFLFNSGRGAGMYGSFSTIDLTDCVFQQHTQTVIEVRDSELTCTGCTLFDGTDTGIRVDYSTGYIDTCSIEAMENSGITADHSTLTVVGCDIVDNTSDRGGGIRCESECDLILTQSRIAGNTAELGGGIYLMGITDAVIGGSVSEGNQFDSNTASLGVDMFGDVDPLIIDARYNTFSGAHLSEYYITPQAAFDLTGCTSDTVPVMQDVFVKVDGDDSNDGLTWDTAFRTVGHALRTVSGSDGNPVTVSIGPGIYSNTVTGEIFPLYVPNHVNIQGDPGSASIFETHSETGFAMFFHENSETADLTVQDASGTGIMVYRSTFEILNCVVRNCGRGIEVNDSDLTLTACTISDNNDDLGGINIVNDSICSMTGCYITDNTNYNGGGIHCHQSSMVLEECVVDGNESANMGGGIHAYNSTVEIHHSRIAANRSNDDGGALVMRNNDGSGELLINDVSFELNESVLGHGGAVYLQGGVNYQIRSGTFLNNIAGISGGAIGVLNCSPVITGSGFDGNVAPMGGAISLENSDAVIGGTMGSGNTFGYNTGHTGADLVYLGDSASPVDARNNTFAGYGPSDYYVSPQAAFDLMSHNSQLTPMTGDIYVSPDGTDDAATSGHTPDHPFRTLGYALSRVYGTAADPAAIHLAAGTYSTETNGETYPLGLLPNVSITGSGAGETILTNAKTSSLFFGYADTGLMVSNLSLTGSAGAMEIYANSDIMVHGCAITGNIAYEGAGIYNDLSSLTVSGCTFLQNKASHIGAGIYSRGDTLVYDSVFMDNTAYAGGGISIGNFGKLEVYNSTFENNTTDEFGAGVHGYNGGSATIGNCLFTGNQAGTRGGGFYSHSDTTAHVFNCTFAGNSADTGGGVWTGVDAVTAIENSIFWQNTPQQIKVFRGTVTVDYSLVEGGWTGTGNIDDDPLFTEGSAGEFYLSHIDAGQVEDSPCIDAGSLSASGINLEFDGFSMTMNDGATRTDHEPDTGQVDMGFHQMDPQLPEKTGVRIHLSHNPVTPGDMFSVTGYLDNTGLNGLGSVPVFFILEIFGTYYFWPSWIVLEDDIDFQFMDLARGTREITVVHEFQWPQFGSEPVTGLVFYGAMLTDDMQRIRGEMALVMWGFNP